LFPVPSFAFLEKGFAPFSALGTELRSKNSEVVALFFNR